MRNDIVTNLVDLMSTLDMTEKRSFIDTYGKLSDSFSELSAVR